MFLSRDPTADPFTDGDVTFGFDTRYPPAIRDLNGSQSRLYLVRCPGRGDQQRWVNLNATAADLIPGVTDTVRGRLQLPEPSINPTPADGGFVNLGLWLAVIPQTLEPITAEAGPAAWITVRPRLTSTNFNLGNGDNVTCDGTGVPIEAVHPDLDVLEQSPWCGYTYRRSSPDDAPYQLTISTTWELPYTSSNGAGTIPAMQRSITVDYDIDEIQTVGVSN